MFFDCDENTTMPRNCTDKMYTIRPFINFVSAQFEKFIPFEFICINERIVSVKGRSYLTQYNSNKRKVK